MKLADAVAAIAAYEKLANQLAAAIDARKDLAAKLTDDVIGKLVDAFPSAEAFTRFTEAMPKAPALDEVIKAFPDPKELTGFIDGALKGNVKVLATLAERGCGRDPAVLKQLADTFKTDPDKLGAIIEEGGVGHQPEALAAMFSDGCDRDPAKLKTMLEKFATKQDREKLAKVIGEGGLGAAPEALGGLAKSGNGDLLKKLSVAMDAKPEKLRGLLKEGGLDGKMPGRPDLLADIVTNGLGGDPARLEHLHDAFPGDLKGLGKIVRGLDGIDNKTSQKAGERLASLLAGFKTRGTIVDDKDVAKKLRDPFLTSISAQSMTGKAPPVAPDQTQLSISAASARAAPPKAAGAGTLAGGIADGKTGALLSAALADPKARAAAESAQALTAGLGRRADDMRTGAAAGLAEQTDKTKAATKAANEKLAEIGKRLDGAPAAEIEALAKLGEAALEAARIEPDEPTRNAALDAAKAVEKGVGEALKRLAAATLAGAPGAVAALAAKAGLAATTPQGVKDAVEAITQAAMIAAAAAQGATADPAISSTSAKQAIGQQHTDTNKRTEAEKGADAAATKAAEAAKALTKLVTEAPQPVDAALLGRAAEAAAAAVADARKAPTEAVAKDAFDAAKLLTAAVDNAVRNAAARLEIAAAQASTTGKAAFAAAAEAEVALDVIKRLPPGNAAVAQLEKAAKAARLSALTGAEADRMGTEDKVARKQSAQDAAYRTAAGAGGAPDPTAVKTASDTADTAAENATLAATAATQALKTATIGTDPAAYAGLIETASTTAEVALQAARAAVDDGKRDAAVKAAKDAATEIAIATKKLALSHRNAAKTTLSTAHGDKAKAGVAAANGLAAGTGSAAAAQQAFDDGKAAIGDNAAADLATYAEPDSATANAVAETRAAANLPGAGEQAKLAVLVAERGAAEALAGKANAALGIAVAAVPTPPALNQNALQVPPPDAHTKMLTAQSALKAANTAAVAWHDAALKAQAMAERLFKLLEANKKRTPEEDTARGAAETQKNAAQAEVDAAAAMLATIGSDTGPATTLRTQAKGWTWNANRLATAPANKDDLQAMAGFAVSAKEDAKVNALPEADLIRVGATTNKQAFVAVGDQPCNAGDGATAEPAIMDTDHISLRHVRTKYQFAGESLPKGSEHDAGMLLEGGLAGIGDAGRTTAQKDLVREGGRNKPNSFLPEETIPTNLKTWVEAALKAVAASAGKKVSAVLFDGRMQPNPPPPPPPKPWDKIWVEKKVNVLVPPLTEAVSVTIGLSPAAAPANPLTSDQYVPKARMFYANTRDMPSTPDMLVLAKALGVSA